MFVTTCPQDKRTGALRFVYFLKHYSCFLHRFLSSVIWFFWQSHLSFSVCCYRKHLLQSTAWKLPKYGVFSGLYFPAFELNTERIRTRNNSVFELFSRSDLCCFFSHHIVFELDTSKDNLKDTYPQIILSCSYRSQQPRPATSLKKSLWHRCFPVNFSKFLRTPILQNTSGRLLLSLPIHHPFVVNHIKKLFNSFLTEAVII